MKHSEGLKQFLKASYIELCHSLSFISNPCLSRERLFHFQSSLLIYSNHQHTPQLFHRCWELRRPFFACSADWVEVCVGNVTVERHHLQYTRIIISTMHCDCPHCRIDFHRLFLALLSLMKSILTVIVHITSSLSLPGQQSTPIHHRQAAPSPSPGIEVMAFGRLLLSLQGVTTWWNIMAFLSSGHWNTTNSTLVEKLPILGFIWLDGNGGGLELSIIVLTGLQ